MKLLISNDDGVTAEGLALLEDISREFFERITVVAPLSNRSGSGHAITINEPIRLISKDGRFAVDGSPTDSVMLGLGHVLLDDQPDFVFSGINSDKNIGEEIIYSGTVSVAREACICGIPAVAFSQQLNENGEPEWDVSRKFAPLVIEKIIKSYDYNKNVFLNVNFPGVSVELVKGIRVAKQRCRNKEKNKFLQRSDPRGEQYFWLNGAEYGRMLGDFCDDAVLDDADAVSDGYVSITPVGIDMTAYEELQKLNDTFEDCD